MELTTELEKLPSVYAKLSDDYAEKKAVYENLKKQEKTIFAKIKLDYGKGEDRVTQSELETLTYADKDYIQYIKGMNIAHRLFLRAESRMNGVEVQFKCLQSLNANYCAQTKIT
jgi:catalase